MNTPETAQVAKKLTLAFPALGMDPARCAELCRKLEPFEFDVGHQAAEEYVDHGGDQFFELTRFLAIAYRLTRQKSEREAAIRRAMEGRSRVQDYRAEREREARIDALIAEMSDEEVMHEWGPLLSEMQGLPRDWASSWGAAKVRANVRFKRRIGELMSV